MVQDSTPGSDPAAKDASALDREADHVDRLMRPDQGGSTKAEGGANGLNNATQVDQDNRIDKMKADAKAAGSGPDRPEDGLNQDG